MSVWAAITVSISPSVTAWLNSSRVNLPAIWVPFYPLVKSNRNLSGDISREVSVRFFPSSVTIRTTGFGHDLIVLLEDRDDLGGPGAGLGDIVPELKRFGLHRRHPPWIT